MATLSERSIAKRKLPQAAEPLPGSGPSADEEIDIFCWIRKVSLSTFGVSIKKSQTVDRLKMEILKEMEDRERVPKSRLLLWKVQLPHDHNISETADSCSLDEVGEYLEPSKRLYKVFVDEPAENHVHIIACIKPARAKREYAEERTDGIPQAVKLLKTELGKAAPSSLAVSGFSTIVGPGHAIACNRPFENNTIPIVLLQKVFGIFKDRCKRPPSEAALTCLENLVPVACKWYDSEDRRQSAIQSVLEAHTGLPLHRQLIPGTTFHTGGNLPVCVMPAVIRACRNEHGDTFSRAIIYYGHFLTQALADVLHYYNYDTRFPSILMVDMASYMGFYGAVWDGSRVKVEPLTPLFNLSTHRMERDDRYAIASSLDALVTAAHDLGAHYQSLDTEARAKHIPSDYDSRLQKARGFPFLTSYEHNGRRIALTYAAQLNDEKLIFSAIINQDDSGHHQCLVKYTRRYSKEAHEHLAFHGFAPTLWQCVQVSAEWIAVIMDRSEYEVLYGQDLSNAEQDKVRRKVNSMVHVLHKAGFVHGDIRNVNLLVDVESLASDDVGVHLVDFDWAGRIGEARYPVGINTTTVRRPAGAKSGELISTKHDEDMVSYLF